MKIKIESDVFDIVERIKSIDENYVLMYDTDTRNLEVHNLAQLNSYCFCVKNSQISSEIIEEIFMSNIVFIDKIIDDIDNNNLKIEKEANDKVKTITEYCAREIYNFCNSSTKNLNYNDAFKSVWG